jgi:AcrR family transcriptional regulator
MKSKPKDRILEKAKELFYEQGYSATGINQILSESNSAKASFYESYPSKEILAEKVLRSYQTDILRWMRRMTKSCDTPDKFINIFTKSIKGQLKNKLAFRRGCPIAIFSIHFPTPNGEIRKEFEKLSKTWKKVFVKLLKNWANKRLILQKGKEEDTAMMILNSYEGSLMMWNLTKDDKYIDILKDQLKRIII